MSATAKKMVFHGPTVLSAAYMSIHIRTRVLAIGQQHNSAQFEGGEASWVWEKLGKVNAGFVG